MTIATTATVAGIIVITTIIILNATYIAEINFKQMDWSDIPICVVSVH